MATQQECRAALEALAATLAENAAAVHSRVNLDRPLTCRVTDLGIAFHGRLTGGRLVGLTDGDDPAAKIRLTTTSNDLVGLVNGHVHFASAWAHGRVKIDASFTDLLKLRKLL